MDTYNKLYDTSRKSFIKIAFFISVVIFIVEIAMSAYIIYYHPKLIKLDIISYCLVYIIMPTSINLFLCSTGKVVIESRRFSERTKNYIAVLTILGICFCTSCFHNVYNVLGCSLCFPIYISILFSDKKITQHISALSLVMLFITTFFGSIDGRKNDHLLYIDFAILLELVIGSYFIAMYLLKLEIEKNLKLKESYRVQLELSEQLKYDPLTNLFNMSTFYNVLAKAMDRQKLPLGVAVIDIDNFKKVNDTYGHDNGNTVLVYLSDLLQKNCSDLGDAFRYGGEEFALVFQRTSQEEIKEILEYLQRKFAAHHFDFSEDAKITFSCGIAIIYENSYKPREIFNMADQAMYEAKTTGKNKTVIYKQEKEDRAQLSV